MESAVTAEPNWSRPSLTTLPREIRNQIYRHLVVSSKPIKVCYDYDSLWLYLKAGRRNRDVSTEFLCHAVEGSEIAVEVYEEFFRNNTFDCGSCENLRGFLTTTTTRFNFHNNLFPDTSNHGYLKFEKKPWIRKVQVSIFSNVLKRKLSGHLTHLLGCSHLQQVEIIVFGLTSRSHEINPVDRTIEAIARLCKSIRGKIGGGLIVKVQKDWGEAPSTSSIGHAMISNPELESVSWMWEEPSEEARGRFRKGLGTHKEEIQMLMSAGWAEKKGKVGAWAKHWREDRNEQQQLKKSQLRMLQEET